MIKSRGRGKWPAVVIEHSDALYLAPDIFKSRDLKRIAGSLKYSTGHSTRRKPSPFRSAMSMLVFYINRERSNLPEEQRRRPEAAKDELRRVFGRPVHS